MANNVDPAFGKVCEVFGFKTLNEHQKNALKIVIEKKKDVFANLPTGFGKSVIFQALPLLYACVSKAEIKIVVSSLISLVKDQVSLLLSLTISATSLNNETSETDKRKVERRDPAAGKCFQNTRYPAVKNFDQISRNSSFTSSKNIRYLFRNLKGL